MNHENQIEQLVRALHSRNYSSSEVKNMLTRIIAMPDKYNQKTFSAWEKANSSRQGALKDLLKEDTEGKRGPHLKTWLKEITNDNYEAAANIARFTADVKSVFASTDAKNKIFDRNRTAENPEGKLDETQKSIYGTSMDPARFVSGLVSLLAGGPSVSTLKAYISKNINPTNSGGISKELRSKGHLELFEMVGNGTRADTKTADSVFEAQMKIHANVVRDTNFKSMFRSSGELGIKKLYDLLKSNNSTAMQRITGYNASELAGILDEKEIRQSLVSLWLDELGSSGDLKKAINSQKDIIKSKTEQLIKDQKDNPIPSKIKNLNTVFADSITRKVRDEIAGVQAAKAKEIFGNNELPDELIISMKVLTGKHSISETNAFRDNLEIVNISSENGILSIPMLPRMSEVYAEGIGLETINKLLKDQEKLKKEGHAIGSTLAERDIREKALERAGLKTIESKLKESEAIYPAAFKQARRLMGNTSSKLRANIRRSSFLRSVLRTGGEERDSNIESAVEGLIIKDGSITLGNLFKAALHDIAIKIKNKDDFYNAKHVKALISLASLSGVARSKWFAIYQTASQMVDSLESTAKGMGSTLDRVIARVDIQDIASESTREAGKGDERRAKWSDPGKYESEGIRNYRANLNKHGPRQDVISKYSGKHFDRQGKITSDLYRTIFKEWKKNMYANGQASAIESAGGVNKAFQRYMNGPHAREGLRSLMAEELRESMSEQEFKNYDKLLREEFYLGRYQRAQKFFTFTAYETVKGPNGRNIIVPLPMRRESTEEGSSLNGGIYDADKADRVKSEHEQLEYVHGLADPNSTLDEKYKGFTFVGMIHAAKDDKDLERIEQHIYDYVPKEHLDQFQENSGDTSISNLLKNRRDELSGLGNAAGVTPNS